MLSAPAVASREPAGEDLRMEAYARARLAEAEGSLLDAASAYRQAAVLDPSNPEVARRGFRQAVLAGDKALALRTAHALDQIGQLPRDGTVLLLIDALDRKKWDEARGLIDRLEQEQNLGFLVPFMTSWVSMRDGPYDLPVVPAAEPYAAFAIRYLEEQLLLQRLALGDVKGAEEAYAQAKARGTPFGAQERARIAVRFDRMGNHEIAIQVLTDGAADDPEAMLIDARKRYRNFPDSPQSGLATLMVRLALDLLGQGEGTATLSIARMASFADPSDEDVRLAVARAALASGYRDTAYSEAGKILPGSAGWLNAQAVRLQARLAQGRNEEAVEQARAIAASDGSARAQRLLGDVLMQAGDYAAAADAYGGVRAAQEGKADAALLLQLGGALEQAGKWQVARPILEQVVELSPDSAPALNHLGYALADRSENLPEAIRLLEKANRLRPQEPAFTDSLGWAFFRSGQYDKALPLLQDAVAAAPENAEINDHMGDLLWAMGRRFEARYAWKAALVGLDDEAGDETRRKEIASKIERGNESRGVSARP
ncbi:MAG: tetratricopeptide repeat protein [Sphingobium sp.]